MDPILAQLLASDPVLAQQAGLPAPPVPSVTRPEPAPPVIPVDPAGVPTPQPSTQPASASAPSSPVPSPAPDPMLGVKAGTSRGTTETDLAKLEAIEQSPSSQRYSGKLADLRTGIKDDLSAYQKGLADVGGRMKEATRREGDLMAQRAQDQAAAAQKAAVQQAEMAKTVQSFQDAAFKKIAQHEADFQSQLAQVRAMRIDPNQWYTDRSAGQKVADGLSSGVAMYWMATGKPAMAEVGKRILDGFDTKVKQNIDSQVENLRNQQRVSDGFMAAWQMASQNAVSEAEAKARVEAMMYQSFKDKLVADIAAKHDSDIMRAGAEKMAADLDGKILEAQHRAGQEAQDGLLKIAGYETQKSIANLEASVRRDQMANDLAVAEAKGKGKSLKDMGLFPVADPETKIYRYSAKTEAGQKILDDLGASSDAFQKSMERLEAAVRNAGGKIVGGTDNLNKLKSSDDQEVKALAEIVSFNLAKMLNPDGKISDADAKKAADSMSIAGLLNRAEGVSAREQIRNFVIDNTQSYYGQYAYDIDPATWEAMGFPSQGAQAPVQEGARAASNTEPTVTSDVERASAVFKTPGSRDKSIVAADTGDAQWLAYVNQGGTLGGAPAKTQGLPGLPQESYVQPGWADDISLLGRAAAGMTKETDLRAIAADKSLSAEERDAALKKAEEARVNARRELEAIQKMRDSENVDAAYFAKYVLDDISRAR